MTATLYFPITPNTGFLYMVNLYFLYHYSTRLETGETTHTQSQTLNGLFVILIFSLVLFFQGRSKADLRTTSSCSSSTGYALLYPFTGIIKYKTLQNLQFYMINYYLPTVNHSFNFQGYIPVSLFPLPRGF